MGFFSKIFSARRNSTPGVINRAVEVDKAILSKRSPAIAPRLFSQLSHNQQRTVRRNIIRSLRVGGFLGRGKYDPVTRDENLRERLYAETGGEEEALTINERNRLIALVRNLSRNSDHFNGMMEQLCLNVVGTVGGKANFNFSPELKSYADQLRDAFGTWARECEFFDGATLQQLLQLSLRTKYTTGRAVLLFDDNLICDSGKVIVFEGDAIANLTEKDFAARFPEGWSQHQGLIKDQFGRTRGALVSISQRGVNVFEKLTDDKGRLLVWALIKDESSTWLDAPFTIYQNLKRINQIVSVPSVAPSVGSIMDLEDLSKFELQSAKKASQTFASVSQTENQATNLTDGLDPNIAAPLSADASDDEIAAAVETQTSDLEEVDDMEFTTTEGAATIYEILPPGLKMDMLSPTHPNTNVIGMVTWIKQNASWANGIAGLYATGKADSSYSASLVELAITWQKYRDEQQGLKNGILDWLVLHWYKWAVRKNIIPAMPIESSDWIKKVVYNFPRMEAPDRQKEQAALAQGLKNRSVTLHDVFGSAEYAEKLALIAQEEKDCKSLGIVHPGSLTVSGQSLTQDPEKNEDEK